MTRRSIGLAVAALAATAGAIVAPSATPAGAGTTTSTIVVQRGERRSDGTLVQSQVEVPVTVSDAPRRPDKPTGPPRPAPTKLSPTLAAAAKDPSGPATQRVIVTFREVRARSDALVAGIASQRRAAYQALSADLARMGVQTLETFWLIKGMVVVAPRSALLALSQRSDVAYVEPDEGGVKPPDSDPNNDEAGATALMGTDPYYFTGAVSYIGILDTGVRKTHALLRDNFQFGYAEDLVNPTNPDTNDCFNHGTSTAAVIAGSDGLGPAFRGMTRQVVDSFKVYRSDACGILVPAAAVRGFQRAVQVSDRVIVAEIGAVEGPDSALSAAAGAAYDAGAVVVAGNGNNGPSPGSVIEPAAAHKVLGIGAVDLQTLATPDYQSVGPTLDGRVKPDVQAPTNVETASPQSDTATQVFGGTSAATAHAGAFAAVLRNLLRGNNFEVDPGAVNAFMIAMGSLRQWTPTQGAGLLRIGSNWSFQVAQPTIGNHQNVDIRVGVGPNQKLRLAIWWPEQLATHNDIDLLLIGPDGHTVLDASASTFNVFERINTTALPEGVYTVRINGFSVPGGSQLVHLFAMNTP
jgi:serine protease AprX